MQQRNLLIFALLSFLLVVGTMQVRQRWFPPQPDEKDKDEEVANKPTPNSKKPADLKKPVAPSDKLPPQPVVTSADKLIPLGDPEADSKFHLYLLLDPLGAGVRTVVLNKFKQATSVGLPDKEDGKVQSLALVPAERRVNVNGQERVIDVNREFPSYLLYHFDPNDKDLEHPLDTLGRTVWTVEKKDGKEVVHDTIDDKARQQVTFRTELAGAIIRKRYSLTEGDYHVGLSVTLERAKSGPRTKAVKFRYQLTGAKGLPVEGKWYTAVYRNALFGTDDEEGTFSRELEELRSISNRGGGDQIQRREGGMLRYAGVADQYFAAVIAVDNKQPDQKFLYRARATLETAVIRGKIKEVALDSPWLVLTTDEGKGEETIYLPEMEQRLVLADQKPGTPIAIVYRPLTFDPRLKGPDGKPGASWKKALEVRVGDQVAATHDLWEDDITVRVISDAVELKPDAEPVTHKYVLYHGPVKPSLLGLIDDAEKRVDASVVERYSNTLMLNTLTDYHSPGVPGRIASKIGWTYVVIKCTNIMHVVLYYIHQVVPSLGLCIIFLTVLVRGMMFPLSRKQALMGMKMQALAPELKQLQAKYKDDKQALGMAQWDLYRKHGVNPMGSCWVIFLQMPIFMGLYYALQESIQFRLASFWPTWIQNLAAPDMLLRWGESIPMLSRPQDFGGFLYLGPYLNLLPILAVSLMIAQQKMMMPPPADEQQEIQQKMMKWMMVIFGLMFYKVAAGLCLYFIASSLWGFAERKLLPKAKLTPVVLDAAGKPLVNAVAITTSPVGASTSVTAASGVTTGKKLGRNKRKSGRSAKDEEAQSGLGRLRQRLSDWWADVLEQAKKK